MAVGLIPCCLCMPAPEFDVGGRQLVAAVKKARRERALTRVTPDSSTTITTTTKEQGLQIFFYHRIIQ